jgi:hypothetical protein
MSGHPNDPNQPVARERETVVTNGGGGGAGVAIAVIVAIIAIVVLLFVFLGGNGTDDGIDVPDQVDVDVDEGNGGTDDGGADAEAEAEADVEADVEPDADRAPRADGPAAEPTVGSLGFGPAGWDEEAALLQGTARQLLQRPPPRLRYGSGIPVPEHDVARLFAEGASLVGVLTLGPWRVVNVGARFRTLPAWLRLVLHTRHWHCRGPDCDRPAAWTQAHHEDDWSATHVTDLNATIPLCLAHHMLITSGEWTARLDLVTGEVVWRSATGRVVVVPPPWVRARTPTAGNARPTG